MSLDTLKFCDGDIKDADYMMDCSIVEYYYRLKLKIQFLEWKSEK